MTTKTRSGRKSGRSQGSTIKPWDSMRAMSPLALTLRLEKDAERDEERHDEQIAHWQHPPHRLARRLGSAEHQAGHKRPKFDR